MRSNRCICLTSATLCKALFTLTDLSATSEAYKSALTAADYSREPIHVADFVSVGQQIFCLSDFAGSICRPSADTENICRIVRHARRYEQFHLKCCNS